MPSGGRARITLGEWDGGVELTDATGPVYSRRAPVTLDAALTAAIDQLDPAIPLAEGDARPLA